MKQDLAIWALDMAANLRQPPEGCIFHSDRGSQYCAYDYQKRLQKYGLRPSMSGKGNCYDNTAVETFFNSLKAELLWRTTWPTRRQAEAAIFQHINGFNNARRRHLLSGRNQPARIRSQGGIVRLVAGAKPLQAYFIMERTQMQENIKRAAIKLIARHGYEAMTLRMLAQELGLKAPSLYNYVTSKQDLLFSIIKSNMEDFLDYVENGLKDTTDPIIRLDRFVELNVGYDCFHADAVFVGKNERRSLNEENMAHIKKMTERYENILIDILIEISKNKLTSAEQPHVIAYALFAMLTGITTWFKPTNTSSVKEVQHICRVLVRRMVQVPDS